MSKTISILMATLFVAVAIVPTTANGATILDDFSGGVIIANHPEGAGVAGTYYDITNDAFGTASVGTLDSSDALKIDDGGFTNGVYVIYSGVVPATGVYTVSANMHINEDPDRLDQIDAYQIGAVVNGIHRGVNPSDLSVLAAGPGTGIGNYAGLTDDDDSGLATQLVTTSSFSATAGDDVLIAFSTNLTDGNFDLSSGFFEDGHILVDNIMLNAVPEPSTLLLTCLAGIGLVFRRK